MNIHPIFVHFPIALLTLYAILEILPIAGWYPHASWKDIKAFLVIFGGLGILAALVTGQLAERSILAIASPSILHVHKLFAGATTVVFGILASAYLIRWIFEKHADLIGRQAFNLSFLKTTSDFILKRWITVPLAIIGFGVLSITGVLGSIIVYGSNSNFITRFVYSIFSAHKGFISAS